ncbi:MAG: BatD family protein [Bacteroidia bacterium]
MKRILTILFSLFLTFSMSAQKLTLKVSKNKVAAGEAFQITIALDANGGGLKIAGINDFDIYQGPYQSTNMQIINGVMSQSASYTYVIAAKKEGKFTLGPATMIVGNNTLTSNAVSIEVSKAAAGATSPGNQSNPNTATQEATTPSSEDIGDNLFARTTVSKTKAYQGEQITVVQKVYSRYQFRGFEDIKFPDYTGFFSHDVPIGQMQITNETLDGVTYYVIEIKRSYIFAQHSGKLEIPPVTAQCVVRKKSNRRPRTIIEQMFGGGYEDVEYTVKSKPVPVEIIPLPEEGKPENFSGAVGEFTFKAELNKEKMKANEGADLFVTINGKGNIKLVEAPKVTFPDDFKKYDVKTKENINVGANSVSGTKTFDYFFNPRHEGDYVIDQISFNYFDPVKKQYVVLPNPDFKLHVDKGDGEQAVVFGNSSNQSDVKVLGNDIRYIKKDLGKLEGKNEYFFNSFLFWTLVSSPVIAFFLCLFLRRKNIEQNKDLVAVKSRKATKMAKKRLALAEKHIRTGNKEAFYIEIFRSLYGYISDKLNIPVADLNKEHITEKLRSRSVNDNTIAKLVTTLDSCEYAHYAPGAASGDLQHIYNSTVELITDIEDEIR